MPTATRRKIQFVYPQNTKTVSLSGGGCALNCSHCNKHYIKQMDPLHSPVPEGTKSFLISGGLKKDGTSFILDKKKELQKIKAEGKYHFNSHVGFVDPEELDEMAKIVDYVSFDFVSDSEVIKRVYKLDRRVEDYIKLYKLLTTKITTYPHVTIGLDAGRIHWEYEAIDILAELGADRLVLNVLIPTPGTEFANVPKPDLAEVRKVFQHARKAFGEGRLLIVGCMRPWGSYRGELDVMAVEEGVDRIVQPTLPARALAEKLGCEISFLYECCALDTPAFDERPQTLKPVPLENAAGCGSSGGGCGSSSGSSSMIQFKNPTNKLESPEKIRVSTGSAGVLGLKSVKLQAQPKTMYLMNTGGCEYSCGFCAQGKHATSSEDKLSRVTWPEYSSAQVFETLTQKESAYKRICMQVVNTQDVFKTLPDTVRKLRAAAPHTKIAMTVRTYKMSDVDAIFAAGADEVGLSIDAIDPKEFQKIKGGNFEFHKKFVLEAADRHPGKIATHLIVGLGETEKQVVELMQELHAHKVIIALFAFTPVRGARMEHTEPPNVGSYRRVQIALHLIRTNKLRPITYTPEGQIADVGYSPEQLSSVLAGSNVFETSGCSDCNRPYYNERAGAKEPYNYPEKLNDRSLADGITTAFNS